MRTLRLDTKGDDVKAWQEFLRARGLFDGTTDGSFGPLTLESTRAFQRANDLSDDGVVGPNTVGAALELGLGSVPASPPGGTALTDAWAAPEPPGDETLFVVQDPRMITDHSVGVLPCPPNPPPPVGWAYWQGSVPPALTQLAREVESDSARFPLGSFVQTVRGGVRVAARVEWHTLQGKTGKHGCFRGTNLFQPKPLG